MERFKIKDNLKPEYQIDYPFIISSKALSGLEFQQWLCTIENALLEQSRNCRLSLGVECS